jgi:hypothetical protein
MIEGELKHRDRVVHTRTGGEYLVADMGLMKIHDGEWVSGVIYAPVEDPGSRTFIRDEATFRLNFHRKEA